MNRERCGREPRRCLTKRRPESLPTSLHLDFFATRIHSTCAVERSPHLRRRVSRHQLFLSFSLCADESLRSCARSRLSHLFPGKGRTCRGSEFFFFIALILIAGYLKVNEEKPERGRETACTDRKVYNREAKNRIIYKRERLPL